MLIRLSIRNFAVFENENINFGASFNVITGETGSGKSVIIESIFLLLGVRANKELIRAGKDSALVEALFDVSNNDRVLRILEDNNIELEEDNLLIVSRELFNNGKNASKVNGKIYTLGIIKSIVSNLINIYGQFGHQSLFRKENHIRILDNLINDEIKETKKEYKDIYKQYEIISNKIAIANSNFEDKDIRIEQLQYELNEIEFADLKYGEEESLLKEIKRLSNVEKIKNNLEKVIDITSNSEYSIVSNTLNISKILNNISSYDEKLVKSCSEIDIILDTIQDFLFNIINYKENIVIDEENIKSIEDRLSVINRLKRKYGYSIEKIKSYHEEITKELEELLNIGQTITNLNDELNFLIENLEKLSKELTEKRKISAEYLEENIVSELRDLNMKNVKFKVLINKNAKFSLHGKDSVEFLISTNIGSELNSIQKIVSGGEASRVMLAFKKIMTDIDFIPILIFDEIDTGISGKTSQMAGEKINYISKKHQVVCITHSPQIAAIAENNFLINKKIINKNTFSEIIKLNKNGKINEIARLLSGITITEKSVDNAKELIEINKIDT